MDKAKRERWAKKGTCGLSGEALSGAGEVAAGLGPVCLRYSSTPAKLTQQRGDDNCTPQQSYREATTETEWYHERHKRRTGPDGTAQRTHLTHFVAEYPYGEQNGQDHLVKQGTVESRGSQAETRAEVR